MEIPVLNDNTILENLNNQTNPFFNDYLAFYSSWFGGITQNPHMMLLPIDDHMVHRGDGIFEGLKAINRAVYLFDEHMQRLLRSAEIIKLKLPLGLDDLKHIVFETLRVANHDNVFIRIFLSRGPGDFSVNPYDSIGGQCYIVVYKLKHPKPEKYEKGVVAGISTIPIKESWMAQVKSCNYLPNVLMKKEAVDRNLDFVIGIDECGFISEGPTENIMMLDKQGTLVLPEFKYILKGTTMMRACELANEHGIKFENRPISPEDLQQAAEVMICGTSPGVLPVVEFEGHKISDGKPGVVAKKLQEWLIKDWHSGPKRTSF